MTLNCRSHQKEVSHLQGRGSMSRGKLLGGVWGDFERFVFCTDSERLSKPIKGREYKLIHTYISICVGSIVEKQLFNYYRKKNL